MRNLWNVCNVFFSYFLDRYLCRGMKKKSVGIESNQMKTKLYLNWSRKNKVLDTYKGNGFMRAKYTSFADKSFTWIAFKILIQKVWPVLCSWDFVTSLHFMHDANEILFNGILRQWWLNKRCICVRKPIDWLISPIRLKSIGIIDEEVPFWFRLLDVSIWSSI